MVLQTGKKQQYKFSEDMQKALKFFYPNPVSVPYVDRSQATTAAAERPTKRRKAQPADITDSTHTATADAKAAAMQPSTQQREAFKFM